MALGLRRRGPSNFERAAEGSMTLIEHLRELRSRLFRASLAILIGFAVGMWLAQDIFDLLAQPYYNLEGKEDETFVQLGAADSFLLRLKIALWAGLVLAAPVWLFQLWLFIAPGLHRHERRYAYVFVAIAAPLFAAGAFLAYFVVEKGLHFLLDAGVTGLDVNLEVTRYISFITGLILIFGLAFEFPLIALMLNVFGLASGRRLLSWWRTVVFLFFLFAAIVTPTPDPFGMTALAVCLSLLYFGAVGVAFLNDRRRARRDAIYEGIGDDEASPLEYDPEPVEAGAPVDSVTPVPAPLPLDSRYDDTT